jgi:UDP-N-acetylmuramoylalanine--D-glutamate ligase
MKIAILGYSLEGQSSYEYFAAAGGHELTICDQDPKLEVPAGALSVLGAGYLDNLDQFDLLVRTPGLLPQDILAKNPGLAAKITSNTNEFLKACPTRNIIGVTGTKGKGTTSTLISRLLEAAGKSVQLGGNIGVPALSVLSELTADSWVVLELSSFQLIDLRTSPHIAICLMVVPEHLDLHTDLDEYVHAKAQLFAHQSSDDIAIYFAENKTSKQIAAGSSGRQLPYYAPPGAYVKDDDIIIDGKVICKTNELKLLGKHNWQNVCAALTAVWQAAQDTEALRSVLTGFNGLPFRIELRREVAGVRYYNDSYATGPGSAIAALQAVPGPKVMIIGGYERGLDLTELVEAAVDASDEIRKILLIGASAERVAHELKDGGFTNFIISDAEDMRVIVKEATELAQKGDAVVLSPGFASFDMFNNFKERGIIFNKVVEAL